MDTRADGRFKQKFPKDWKDDMHAHYSIEEILEMIKNFTAGNVQL